MLRINTILQILLCSAATLGYLPLAPHLQRFPAVAVPVAILFAFFGPRRKLVLGEKPALFISLGLFCYFLLQVSRHNLVEPAANMLAIFLAIRLAGVKSPRNFLQTVTLSLFCLAASTLFDLGPRFVLFLVLMLLIITVSLVLLTFKSSLPEFELNFVQLRSVLKIALMQPLLALPLTLLLFFILPRTQFPLWQGLTKAGLENPGISDTIQPGDKSAISSEGGVVFRAEMPRQAGGSLYWRVIVLNSLKGNSWIRRQPPTGEMPTIRGGTEVRQTIFLEPGKIPFLPALDLPLNIGGFRGVPTADQLFPSSGLYNRRRTYEADSRTGGHLATANRVNHRFYTTLPDSVPPALRTLAELALKKGVNDQQRLDAIEKAFFDLKLSYGSSDLATGPEALEEFLFKGKKGHCELFAASFALALRLAGIPARLVGGYYGGNYNELAGYYIITAEKAHVWVEAWIEGRGWVNLDPSSFAVNFAEASGSGGKSKSLRLRIALFLDTLSYYWNRLVITYDLESQFSAISASGAWLRNFSFNRIPLQRVTYGAGLLTAAAGAMLLLFRRRRSAEELILEGFSRTVKKRFGIVLTPFSGLHESLRGVDDPAVKRFVAIYTGAIYRDRKLSKEEIALLRTLLKEMGRPDNCRGK